MSGAHALGLSLPERRGGSMPGDAFLHTLAGSSSVECDQKKKDAGRASHDRGSTTGGVVVACAAGGAGIIGKGVRR